MGLFVAVCLGSSFAVAFIATAALRALAPRFGLMDQPAARKLHAAPVPLGGGIGIWLGVVLPLAGAHLAAAWMHSSDTLRAWLPAEVAVHLNGVLYRSGLMWAILAGGTILACVGLLDDIRNLSWKLRLALQFCVAVGLVAGGVRATVFVPLPWVGAAVSVLWILVLVNAFNFLDNMDGLSSGVALIASMLMAIVMLSATSEPRWLVAGVLLILSGSLGGFLWHNRPPARIFMGDTGSYFVGLLVGAMSVLGTFYESGSGSRHVILAPLCILAVPLYDFTSVVLIRLSQGRSPFHPDKSHFSHRLTELGMTRPAAVLTVHLATLTTGLAGLLLYQVDGWNGAMLVVALVLCILTIIAILETVGRRRNGGNGSNT